jgi:hypothetical protein
MQTTTFNSQLQCKKDFNTDPVRISLTGLLCPNKQGQSLEVNAIHTTISTDNQASVGVYCPRRFEAQDLF